MKLEPIAGRLRTRCQNCNHEFYIGKSLAMQCGINSGHCTCPNCKTFLHVEVLEGDAAWTERHNDYVEKLKGGRGPSIVSTIVPAYKGGDA